MSQFGLKLAPGEQEYRLGSPESHNSTHTISVVVGRSKLTVKVIWLEHFEPSRLGSTNETHRMKGLCHAD
jgi:hypothetical protein